MFQEPDCSAGCPLMQGMLTLFVLRVLCLCIVQAHQIEGRFYEIWSKAPSAPKHDSMFFTFPKHFEIHRIPQNGHTVKQNCKSPGTVSLRVPSAFLTFALPTLFRLFSTTAESKPCHVWALILWYSPLQ